jgi:hypothetical protein
MQLGLLARYCAQYSEDGETVGDFADILLRLLLSVNELYTASVEFQGEGRRAFFGLEAQSAVLPNERFAHVIQRYYRFFEWADRWPEGNDDWLPLGEDFTRLMGMSAHEYLTAAFCVLTPFLGLQSASMLQSHPPYFSLADLGSTLRDNRCLASWIERFSISVESLRTEAFEPTFTLRDLAPIIERPLIRFGQDIYFCPLPALLEDSLNTRLYFELYKEYESKEGLQMAKKFSRLQGHFLEEYAALLVKDCVGDAYDVHREIRYAAPGGHRKSPDVIARRKADGAAVLVEVTKTKFRLEESLLSLDETAVMKDINAMVIRKAEQIQHRIDDLQKELYQVPGGITAIAPLVVSGQGIPGLIYLKDRIEAELRSRKLLQDTVPLSYCDIEELEAIALAAPGEIDLFALLREKAEHRDGLARLQSLKNYLYYYRPDLSRIKEPRETTFPEYEMAITNAINPTLRAWGLVMSESSGAV